MAEGSRHETPRGEWFASLADEAGLVFLALRIRPDIAVEFVTPGIEDLLGVSPAVLYGDPHTLVDRADARAGFSSSDLLSMVPGGVLTRDLGWTRPDGDAVVTRCLLRCRTRDDGSDVVEGTLRPQPAASLTQRALQHSEERHRLLAENAWDVIWTMALDGTITYVSPAVERVRGITPAEAMTQTLDQIHPPESAARVVDYYQRLFAAIEAGSAPPLFHGEQEYYRRDGSIMIGELQVIPHVDADGHVVEILGVTRDVSEQKRYEAELTRLAVTDPLTGAWNRRHGQELLTAELEQSHRQGPQLSLLLLDVDHFKTVNDTHGHPTGDRVLVEVAERLAAHLRGTDMLARWGGEEFVVLLRQCALNDAVATAEKLRSCVADTPVRTAGTVTVSIGAAELQPADDLGSWLARADRALYEAKRGGRNRVCC